MEKSKPAQPGMITETLRGIVERVTYHNPATGWSVLRVLTFGSHQQQETVVVHQTRVFAGATMEFSGAWTIHPKFGRQFKALRASEKKPATAAALEKYLGSGLIKGVGPKTARRIIRHFGAETLEVFEERIEELTEVPGIAGRKLASISRAWQEHRALREVMMFLQSHGISTLFAVRIYKQYGDQAISRISEDPYRLAADFYGIGFFTADKVALSIGLAKESDQRLMAGIKHVLAAGREEGHCYLTGAQIREQAGKLLEVDLEERVAPLLDRMEQEELLMVRNLPTADSENEPCYYSRSLYFDERYVARKIAALNRPSGLDPAKTTKWLAAYCARNTKLSDEQAAAVLGIAGRKFSILTGGPGCGKTTTTLVLVRLLEAMGLEVLLAAPTGRAAQRMNEVIGREARTIHRLLEWQQGAFNKNEKAPLAVDFLIVDECSMLDISLTASLLKAVPEAARVLFIGDADQLPSVGAGNVLRDLIASGAAPCFRLSRIFRQARESLIIRYAHQINHGELPAIDSPFKKPELWRQGADCLFLDADEATREQLHFVARAKRHFGLNNDRLEEEAGSADLYEFRTREAMVPYETEFSIPAKFRHVDLDRLLAAGSSAAELRALLKKVHPWSALHYGLAAAEVVRKLYLDWIPKYTGPGCEIQVLTPMTRGSLGTAALNLLLQESSNPPGPEKSQLTVGERILRTGDRVIHRRNNYDLGVFNGDIGTISAIDTMALTCAVSFPPDDRLVLYRQEDLVELDLAYAITIHKAQGSEFEAVIIPVLSQHFKMLYRNLLYTGLTRARKLAVLVGTRKALAMAVRNRDTGRRQTALRQLLQGKCRD